MGLVRIFAAVLVASLVAPTAGAQLASPTGSVHGTVLDEQERPISGAAVALAGPDVARTTTTDEHGDFRFLNAAPGLHVLELARAGFTSARQVVPVQAGKNVVLEVTMRVAGAVATVTVLAEPPTQDSRKVETGGTFDERELAEIPTTRDPWAVVRQVPGVLMVNMNVGSGAGTGPQAFVGKGAHIHQNTISVDGVSLSVAGFSPFGFDFDSLDSIVVATGGSDASRSAPGVSVDLVTKRGTNRILGSARALYTDGSQWDYGVEVGGPVWKDRLWLWGAGASNSFLDQTSFLPDGDPVRSQETHTQWNAKLTAGLVPSNSLTFSYLSWTRFVDGRDASPSTSQESTWDVTFPGESYKLEDSHVFSERLFGSLYLSYVPISRDAIPKGGDVQADVDADYVLRHSNFYQTDERTLRQAGLTGSAFFDTGRLRHELKYGFGYRNLEAASGSVWPADQLVGNAYWGEAHVTRARSAKLFGNSYNTYLSDTIRTGNLTVTAGARFDYQQSRNGPSSVPANPALPELLPAVRYDGDSGYPLTWRTIQPRAGVTHAMGEDRQTLLRASFARFGDEMGFTVSQINAFPGIAELIYPWVDENQSGFVEPSEIDLETLAFPVNVNPDDPGSSAPVNQIAPGLAPPMTDEWILGVERQLSSRLSASIAYTHRRMTGRLFFPLIGTTQASYLYLGNARGTATDPETGFTLDFSEPYYGLTTDPPPVGTVLENRPETTETYDGFELQLLKSFSDGWMLRVGFAYNNWRQAIGPGAIVNPNNETPGTNASGPIVEGGINSTWQFNVSGAVELPLAIRAGMNLFGRQGFPIPYYVEAATLDTLESRPWLQIGSATAYRTPDVFQIDLQLRRDFTIGSRVTITPILACFNLLDSRTVLTREGLVGFYDPDADPEAPFQQWELFNDVATALSGRTIRGGARVSF